MKALTRRPMRTWVTGGSWGLYIKPEWILSLSLALWIWPTHLSARDASLKFWRLSLENGLSQSNVNTIARDRQGYLWFGTQDGLNRFDGYQFKVYRHNPADRSSISDNYIWKILVDHRGMLWIGTANGGLNCFDPLTERFTAFTHQPGEPGSLLSNNVTALYEDISGRLWVGTWGGGLSYLDRETRTFVHFTPIPGDTTSLCSPDVADIREDAFGDLWVATWKGLSRLRHEHRKEKRFTNYRHHPDRPDGLPGDYIWSLFENHLRPGEMWIGTYGSGLCRYHRETDRFTVYRADPGQENGIRGNYIMEIAQDIDNALWIATYDGGVSRYHPESDHFASFPSLTDLPDYPNRDHALSVFCDSTGGIWVGTQDGVRTHQPYRYKFTHLMHLPGAAGGLSHNSVRAVLEDREGGLWVGTLGGGLNYRAPGAARFTVFRHDPKNPHSISSDRVLSILQRKNGEIWIGTEHGGLNRFDPRNRRFIRYQHQPDDTTSLAHNDVSALLEDRKGNFWVGTSGGGMDRFDARSGTFVHFPYRPGDPGALNARYIWAIYEDREGYLWAGTWGRGLHRIDPLHNSVTHYRHDPADPAALSNNTVWCITEDSSGNLWLGTWGGGLNLFHRESETFYHITEQNGLPNNTVYGILPDRRGHLWVSTNGGISQIILSDVLQSAPLSETGEPIRRHISFKNYDISDGLQSREFNQGAYFQGRDGRMYFGGINGLNTFYPDRIRENPHIPPLVLTAFTVLENPVPVLGAIIHRKPLVFPHYQNYIFLEYAALDYTAPQKNRYAYILEGMDPEWIEAGQRRVAGYHYLPPGNYMFRVKGTNSDGVWNETGTSVEIVIKPPFWKTGTFRILALLALAGLILGAFRYRLNRLLEMERLRTRLAADLHDEISGNLSSIAMFGEILQNEMRTKAPVSPLFARLVERVIFLSRDSVDAIRDIIWAIDPKPESMHDLLLRLHDLAAHGCSASGIRFAFQMEKGEVLKKFHLSPEHRKNLWLLLKEAMQNTLKHSRAASITLQVRYYLGQFSIVIADDGIGFEPSAPASGKGMQTMKARARLLNGNLEIQSRPGSGTRVIFTGKTWKLR